LRIKLAEHYIQYILRANYLDFASISWEILEGNLTPQKILNDPDNFNPNFRMPYDFDKRNYVARAVEFFRHRKAHGHAQPPRNEMEVEDYRLATILQFLLFVDLIEGVFIPILPVKPTVLQTWNYISIRHYHLFKETRSRVPNVLTTEAGVSWLDFVAYTAAWAVNNAINGNERFLSQHTVNVVERLNRFLIDKFWQPIEEARSKQVKLTGEVVVENNSNFLMCVADAFFAYLPRNNALSPLNLGDRCSLVVTQSNRDTGEITIRQKM